VLDKFVQDGKGNIFLTPNSASFEELNGYINGLVEDLERARKQAREKFEAAMARPPKDPFNN
jgi:hypothetical protein